MRAVVLHKRRISTTSIYAYAKYLCMFPVVYAGGKRSGIVILWIALECTHGHRGCMHVIFAPNVHLSVPFG